MSKGELGKVYSDGEIICKEGEKGDVLYVIQTGKVAIKKNTPSGEIGIAVLEKGEIFGEMALFDKQSRSATAISQGEARVLSVDKKKLFASISRDPTLVFKLLESMSKRIRKLDEDLAALKKDKQNASQALSSIEDSCKLALEKAKNLVAADNGSVMLYDDESTTLSIKAAFGAESKLKVKLSAGKGIAGDVLRTGRAELVNNVSLDTRFVPGDVLIKSMLCVPLKIREKTLGVINLSNSSEKLFTIDDLKLLDSLATYASLAIQHAKNFANLDVATEKIIQHATMLDMM